MHDFIVRQTLGSKHNSLTFSLSFGRHTFKDEPRLQCKCVVFTIFKHSFTLTSEREEDMASPITVSKL